MQHQQKPDGGEQKEYSGPSVVSYNLEGRKASHLKIPAYRCYGEGDVTVIITVNPQGQVLNAKVMEDISANATHPDLIHLTERVLEDLSVIYDRFVDGA